MTRRRHFRLVAVIAGLLLATDAPAFAQADSHAGHQQEQSKPNPAATEAAKKPAELPPFIPPVTEETRKAAFPDVEGHAVHDRAVGYYVLFDVTSEPGPMDELDRTLRLADDVLRHKIVRIPEAAAGRTLPAATATAATKEESADG